MRIAKTFISGLFIIEPNIFKDDRGYFFESFNKAEFLKSTGLDIDFVQDNESKSSYGVVRGLHYQVEPYQQAKLVRVIKGRVLDVAVDIRKSSPTYGKHFSIELSEQNKVQLFIPRGFAHGFSVLSEEAIFFYKCDNYYNKSSERAILYNDPTLDIKWKVPEEKMIVSDKDKNNAKFFVEL